MKRIDRMLDEEFHDPYYEGRKYPEPTVCEECGAVFQGGRWKWPEGEKPGEYSTSLCPACRRIRDKYPGGVVVLEGKFLKDRAKREDIMNLIKNTEKMAKNQHPLERIMEIKEMDEKVEIYTTDPHLARRMGEAVHRAYKGDFEIKYVEGERFVRVRWRRD